MACHPKIEAHSVNFSEEDLGNSTMTFLFECAGRTAPSLVIFEDLARLYGTGGNRDNLTKITLQHLLNCLDGLGSQDGVIVVAAANDPTLLDPATLRRPGRFDRVVACRPPSEKLRREHLRRLSVDPLDERTLCDAAQRTDGLSFAQLRDVFILAGQFAYQAGEEVIARAHLVEAIELIRGESRAACARVEARGVGFDLAGRAS